MAAVTRSLFAGSICLVVLVLFFSRINPSEYTITLVSGALLATLCIGFWMLFSTPHTEKNRSLGSSAPTSPGSNQRLASVENLPDPMEHDIDIPL
tara:strand:+ start:525 stop:809 length:285 start_codon:yes stop_codon:yes gene_type:complete